jgi:predicted nucleotidyltransferase component of viral defense system
MTEINRQLLTKEQIQLLDLISSDRALTDKFILSGGTALTSFYIPYRYSDDLDFFSQEEVVTDAIVVWLKSLKNEIKYESFDFSTAFNRNLFFIKFASGYILKLEFTYYPFPAIAVGGKYNNLKIDSQLDIATNKLFTIYQNPRARDFTDLYELIIKNNFDFMDLIIKAKTKFDWDVNYLQLSKQLQKVSIQENLPKFIKEYNFKNLEAFFEKKIKVLIQSDLSN